MKNLVKKLNGLQKQTKKPEIKNLKTKKMMTSNKYNKRNNHYSANIIKFHIQLRPENFLVVEDIHGTLLAQTFEC